MLKFYSNENFPIEMVDLLRSRGYDVLTSYEAGKANQKIPDDKVLMYSTNAGRIVITENRQDFINLHFTTGNHTGIVICKADRDYAAKVQLLHDFFTQDTQPMDNRLLRVMKQNLKGSQQTFIIQEYPKISSG
jgi:predicted nuclease of predicted toxin-antitoxin system